MRGSSLYEESDVYRRQTLTYKDGRRAERVNVTHNMLNYTENNVAAGNI